MSCLCFRLHVYVCDMCTHACVPRPAPHHGGLPWHGGGRPSVWEHRGIGGFLLGGEFDTARVWASVPYGR